MIFYKFFTFLGNVTKFSFYCVFERVLFPSTNYSHCTFGCSIYYISAALLQSNHFKGHYRKLDVTTVFTNNFAFSSLI